MMDASSHSPSDPAQSRRPKILAFVLVPLARLFRGFKWAILFLVAGVVCVQLWFLGWIIWWKEEPPRQTHFMSLRLDEMRQKNPDARLAYQWVSQKDISTSLKRAVIASEDAFFVQHHGFDWQGIQLAMEKNRKKGRVVAGGSTITQQLAKNLFLSPSRSRLRKVEEAAITVMLETLWGKERILEVYLNVIEWGDGVFGAEAAAQHYYKTSAAKLSAPQAARLAAMIPNPRFYDRRRNTPFLNWHTGQILSRMPDSQLPAPAQPPAKK